MNLSCTEIVKRLKQGGRIRDKCLKITYKQFFHLVRSRSEKFNLDAELVTHEYTDTILVFDGYVRSERFTIKNENSCLNFITRTLEYKCSNLNRKEKKRNNEVDFNELPYEVTIARAETDEGLIHGDLLKVFKRLDQKCQKILLDVYAGYKMKEIAVRNNFSGANSAGVLRHRCAEKFKTILKNEGYEQFFKK